MSALRTRPRPFLSRSSSPFWLHDADGHPRAAVHHVEDLVQLALEHQHCVEHLAGHRVEGLGRVAQVLTRSGSGPTHAAMETAPDSVLGCSLGSLTKRTSLGVSPGLSRRF